MDQPALCRLAARGFTRAAARVGVLATQYRPTTATSPCATAHARVMAAFSNDRAFGFAGPALWDVPFVYALMDTTDVQAGDILTCAGETYFIARAEPFRPPLCVLCNAVVDITTTVAQAADVADPGGYGTSGDATTQVACATGWPAMIRAGGGAGVPGPAQPGAIHAGGFEMFLPVMPGVSVQPAMWARDANGPRYTIGGARAGPWGTRCLLGQQQV
ncbi:hypothetical protein LU298_13590 [Komagataeibacter intermedius]|uniref:Uncharacterized protein n=2 Tax=Komagataeibacter intermedius TaxID=66229 RepID=A0A0N1FJB1_9PROT|nr:hypothetical protein [Komagataeibacter intermedius]KPH85802.1 hypothetical protein GLUCOINTEAF2_0201057 [Komagataeibacter intermedius AF2]MCF3637523.1 hypothetical protein [Komagataeibacter intermedius]GAN86142.1 hypothetical protein Gain_0015_030 [Komagataeibacter intermedius TF2]GBQ79201.1 hypothetical protein AA0521_3383 [Komagataeibacter intermedius NRIC 0521]